MFGLISLVGATVMICIGTNMPVLIVGRLLQGISAAVVWTVGLALLVDTVGKDEVAQSMGIVAVAMSLGIFLAPVLGGVVYERYSHLLVKFIDMLIGCLIRGGYYSGMSTPLGWNGWFF